MSTEFEDESWPCENCGEREQIQGGGGLCGPCLAEERYYSERENGAIAFADPGGRSALRAATEDDPRDLPCPNCGAANRLTRADRAAGYQCDRCADAVERGGY